MMHGAWAVGCNSAFGAHLTLSSLPSWTLGMAMPNKGGSKEKGIQSVRGTLPNSEHATVHFIFYESA